MIVYKTSKEMWFRNGDYLSFRKTCHQNIISKLTNNKEPSDSKEVILIGGGSGAGKTKFTEGFLHDTFFENSESPHVINADNIKYEIFEFKHWDQFLKRITPYITIDCDNASDYVHDESSDLSMNLFDISVQRDLKFVYDGTFKNPAKYVRLLEDLYSKGYQVNVVIIDVDVQVAIQRVEARNVEGRFVPRNVVEESNLGVAQTFFALKSQISSYLLYDNSVNGEPPTLIAECTREQGEIIHDEDKFMIFRKKAEV